MSLEGIFQWFSEQVQYILLFVLFIVFLEAASDDWQLNRTCIYRYFCRESRSPAEIIRMARWTAESGSVSIFYYNRRNSKRRRCDE